MKCYRDDQRIPIANHHLSSESISALMTRRVFFLHARSITCLPRATALSTVENHPHAESESFDRTDQIV